LIEREHITMPRYEFSEGSSNKFWEITLDGSSFTTTYGRIGTDGQTSLKEWDSDEKAKKEYDKLVAEKVKKGYTLVGGKANGKAAAKPAAAAGKKNGKAVFDDEGDEDEDEKPKKKAAAAKAAPAKKAKKGGARLFEFSEGSSNKFWEIELDGSSFTTRYGKIGTDGQTSLKEWDSEEKAQKEYDKLVAEKTKKGYIEK
jgi:predicted DNA-binding WGR domain protein